MNNAKQTNKKKARSQYQPSGTWIRPEKRLAIYLRDDFRCIYCLRDLRNVDAADITLDHIKCKSDGGGNSEKNLVTACRSCNCSRRDLPISRFAGKETIQQIRRNTKRSLKKYKILASQILDGTFNHKNQNF
jgi:5-methylcytosine-specific restriction endonuclease McrA